MTQVPAGVPERIRSRVDAELPLLPGGLSRWVAAHRTLPREISVSLDPEGANRVAVWLVTDHTGAGGSASRVVYEPTTGAFGVAIDLQNGVVWFQGPDDSFVAAVENM
jgi:hypothetical protein